MHAAIQKTPNMTADQKIAQTSLIDTMTLNTLLTGLEPRLGQLIRASNPNNMLEAANRIKRELQLSYFENQKQNQPRNIPQLIRKPNPPNNYQKTCSYCKRTGHLINECRSRQQNTQPMRYQNFSQPHSNFNNNFQRQTPSQFSPSAQPPQQARPYPNQNFSTSRPGFNNNQNRNPNQGRPSVIQQNPNFNRNQQRTHHINLNSQYQNYSQNDDTNYNEDFSNASFSNEYGNDQYFYNLNDNQSDFAIQNENAQAFQTFSNSPISRRSPVSIPQQQPTTKHATNADRNSRKDPNNEFGRSQPQSQLPRTEIYLNPLLTVNSRNLYNIKDITNTFKILIETGAGVSIFKEKTIQNYPQKSSENMVIQGITEQKILINQFTLIPFETGDPHKVYIYNLDIEFDGLLGSDFLKHCNCIVDLKNEELSTSFKTVPLFKVEGESILELPCISEIQNQIAIEPRTEKVFKLKCNLKNTDAILLGQEKEEVRLPHALVEVNEKGEFLTAVINTNAIPKTIDFSNLNL